MNARDDSTKMLCQRRGVELFLFESWPEHHVQKLPKITRRLLCTQNFSWVAMEKKNYTSSRSWCPTLNWGIALGQVLRPINSPFGASGLISISLKSLSTCKFIWSPHSWYQRWCQRQINRLARDNILRLNWLKSWTLYMTCWSFSWMAKHYIVTNASLHRFDKAAESIIGEIMKE